MKNYISKRLYTEGLTRVRTPGIIAAVLTVLFSVSVPFTALMNQLANKADVNQTLTVVGAKELSSPLLILLLGTHLFFNFSKTIITFSLVVVLRAIIS